jgi:hypothetical protein
MSSIVHNRINNVATAMVNVAYLSDQIRHAVLLMMQIIGETTRWALNSPANKVNVPSKRQTQAFIDVQKNICAIPPSETTAIISTMIMGAYLKAMIAITASDSSPLVTFVQSFVMQFRTLSKGPHDSEHIENIIKPFVELLPSGSIATSPQSMANTPVTSIHAAQKSVLKRQISDSLSPTSTPTEEKVAIRTDPAQKKQKSTPSSPVPTVPPPPPPPAPAPAPAPVPSPPAAPAASTPPAKKKEKTDPKKKVAFKTPSEIVDSILKDLPAKSPHSPPKEIDTSPSQVGPKYHELSCKSVTPRRRRRKIDNSPKAKTSAKDSQKSKVEATEKKPNPVSEKQQHANQVKLENIVANLDPNSPKFIDHGDFVEIVDSDNDEKKPQVEKCMEVELVSPSEAANSLFSPRLVIQKQVANTIVNTKK